MNKIKISKNSARKLIINSQLLDGKTKLQNGRLGIDEIINQLGYIQIDTISAINRSHHHTLWTRDNNYSEEMLNDLQAKDRKIFEYWGHAMSYIPMKDYRYCLPRMKKFKNPNHKWIKAQAEKSKNIIKPIIKRIKEEGPLSSKDFANPEKKRSTWWDWKPAKAALELLFWRGELMVSERRKFQKYYDLRERVLPTEIDTSFPTNEELGRYFILGALRSLGIATEKEIRKFMQPDSSRDSDFQALDRKLLSKYLNELVESKEIVPLTIEGKNNITNYSLPRSLESLTEKKRSKKVVNLLSPFDNLIIQRERIRNIFNFEYSLECYVPEQKRKFGYFVLPILWQNELVGRLDPKADRKSKTFYVRNLVFEQNFCSFDLLIPQLAKKIKRLSDFNNCNRVIFEKVAPRKIKDAISKELSKV